MILAGLDDHDESTLGVLITHRRGSFTPLQQEPCEIRLLWSGRTLTDGKTVLNVARQQLAMGHRTSRALVTLTAGVLAAVLAGCGAGGGSGSARTIDGAVNVDCPDALMSMHEVLARPGDVISVHDASGTPVSTATLGEYRDADGRLLTEADAEPAITCELHFTAETDADFVGFTFKGDSWTAIPTSEAERCRLELRVFDDEGPTWFVPESC